MFLTVSDITFSVVGESEYIYAGTLDPEDVDWISANPEIISVDGGVLTAVGVGTTTIRAFYKDQVVECTAGCLAENADALMQVHVATRQHAKRIPPKVEIDPTLFFSDAAMVGDSVTCNLMVHETATNLLGHPLFLARKNIGVNNFYNYFLNLYYQGYEYSVEDAIALSGVKKAFFLLGINDIAYQTPEEASEKYGVIIDRILEKSPDVQIYIQTCLPVYCADFSLRTHNNNIDRFNELVADIAAEKGCIVIDLAAYIENHDNAMASEYTLDDAAHLNYEGSVVWMDVLRAYAYVEGTK